MIAGGGLVGLSLAIAVSQAMGSGFLVRLCDPGLARARAQGDLRASAISAGGRRFLNALGVWEELAQDAMPITDMAITDSRLEEPVRPVFLTFAGEVAAGQPFAHMVENTRLLAALESAARNAGVVLSASAVTGYRADADGIDVRIGSETVGAQLLVAADGGRSQLRQRAGIPFFGWNYRQSAIVVTVEHERDHGGRAEEHFLPSGPFATLPLRAPDGRGCRSSIVWTETPEMAERLCALDRVAFDRALEKRFGLRLGQVKALCDPVRYPLALGLARRFFAPRLALLGDAAHIIHPIAGQGLNLGLKDAAALAECIIDTARLGLDPGAGDVLRRYDRMRRLDTAAMAAATDVLNRLFSNDIGPLRALRTLGLGMVERFPGLKRTFIREAAGIMGAPPRLMGVEHD